jgi:hypothetical protein
MFLKDPETLGLSLCKLAIDGPSRECKNSLVYALYLILESN